MANTAEQKLQAITYLLENGSRYDPWAEAGLLHAIETIVNHPDCDISPPGLVKLIGLAGKE